MTMVRKQVFITIEQNRLLKQRAKAAGRPEAELIRGAIDRELGIETGKDDWKAEILKYAGALADDEGLAERVAANRRRWNKRVDENIQRLQGKK